jgi:hypothetical protein
MKSFYTILAFIFLIYIPSASQEIRTLARQPLSSFEGRHYLVGFMRNASFDFTGSDTLQLHIATSYKTNVTVSIPNVGKTTYSFRADTIAVIGVPQELETFESELAQSNLVEITADAPISVYAFNSKNMTSDAYNVIPTSAWGTKYTAISLPNTSYGGFNPVLKSEFMVMASDDDTKVTIIPNDLTTKGKAKGIAFSVTLQKGQSYLVQANANPIGNGDMTGSYIYADKPIGLISGHMRTSIPQTDPNDSKDHLVEMIPPESSWGKNFISVPFYINHNILKGDLIRRVNAQSNVFEDFKGIASTTRWTFDNPVCLGQFMASQNFEPKMNEEYDPSMVVLPPLDQYISKVMFQVSRNPITKYRHYLNFVCDSIALNKTRMNGTPITEVWPNIQFQFIGSNPRYYWANIPVAEGKYSIIADTGKFSGVLYGIAPAESYALTLGYSLLDSLSKTDSVPPMLTYLEDCGIVTAQAIDIDLPEKSNLDFIAVVENETENYTWTITYPASARGELTAQPTDSFKDGRISIEARDRAGNGRRFDYIYEAPLHTAPAAILFKNVNETTGECIVDSIVNTSGSRSLFIKRLSLSGDPRISFEKLPPDDISIPPNGVFRFTLCYTPGDGTDNLTGLITADFGCSRFKKIPVSGSVTNIGIATSNHDFRSVLVGTKVSHPVFVTNTSTGVSSSIRIDSLICIECSPEFSFEPFKSLPVDLFAGDTLFINVHFTPSARSDFKNIISAANTPGESDVAPFKNSIVVIGRGIAPAIVGENIDFKRRRVGTRTDSILIIRNNGDAETIVSVAGFSQGFKNAFIPDTASVELPTTIYGGESRTIPLSFIPDVAGLISDSLELEVEWKLHPPVHIAYYGIGTLPRIETDSIEINPTEAGKTRDTTVAAIFSEGNEQLTIDKIFPIGGNLGVFSIASEWFDGRVVPEGSVDSLKVSFSPIVPGVYSAVYGVIHDAMPEYRRDTAYIEIRATALEKSVRDSAYISVQSDLQTIAACRDNTINLTLRNTGNIPVIMDSLAIFSDRAQVSITNGINFDKIGISELKNITVNINTDNSDSVQVNIYVRLLDTNKINPAEVIVHTLTFTVKKHNITLETPSYLEGTPGDEVFLLQKGMVTSGTDVDYFFKNTLQVDRTILFLEKKEGILTLKNAFKEWAIPVTFTQDKETVSVFSTQPIRFDTESQWELSIPLRVMLGSEFQTDVSMSVDGNQCYIGSSGNTSFSVVGICSPSTRRVFLEEGFDLLATYPNPASDGTSIDVEMPRDGTIEVTATDILGNVFSIEQNLYLTKGVHSRKLDITKLPSGAYTLGVRYKADIRHSLIIITK